MTLFALALAAALTGHFNGGHTVPVHRLAPKDAQGDAICLTARYPEPVSQIQTCGQCHDVEKIVRGQHFRTGFSTNDAPVGCYREPWFLVNAASGTVTAVSQYGLPGTKSLAEAGLTYWEFTKEFARHFPGGGLASDPKAMDEAAGDRSRWFVTGPLEANCLACHQQDDDYDSSEWARQVARENWHAAAVAASGLGMVGGMNARLESSWDRTRPENPDDHLFKVPENITYDMRKFDTRGRCIFRVGKPKNARCLACHAATVAEGGHHDVKTDVHLQRGMSCIDCHQNGMSHRVVTKSCRSCHVEKGGAGPKPVHAGIPLVHFKRLSCTVCHAGVTPGGKRVQVRTARANRIGVYGRAQWATDIPYIVEPIFVKGEDGVIRPCRATWTSPDAPPVTWPFAHTVRPARQARGAAPNKCADCHAADSGFFFGEVTPMYPSKNGPVAGKPIPQTVFLKVCGAYHRAFGFMFAFRPLLKVMLWTVFALLCLFTVAAAAVALQKLAAKLSGHLDNAPGRIFTWLVDAGLVCALAYLALSGVVGWCLGGLGGWALCGHMAAGGALAAAVATCVFYRAEVRTRRVAMAIAWCVWLVLAAGTVFTAVMPMMTVYGGHAQAVLLWAHRLAALAFAVASGVVCVLARRKK